MVVLAVVVGIGGGYGAVIFRWLIGSAGYLYFGEMKALLSWLGRYYAILVPAAGGLIVGPLVYFFAREAKGHGVPEVMLAVMHQRGRIRPRVAVIKSLASAICIGSGGSVGREGPIVQIGSALGSTLGQVLRLSDHRIRLLVACGAAAGISATFNAPVGGVLFALEVILRDFSVRSFALVVLSSVASVVISHIYLGDYPAFRMAHPYSLVSAWEFPLYFLLGILAALVARAFVLTLYGLEDFFGRWRLPEYLKPALGGLLVGTIGVWFPQVFGVGYQAVEAALQGSFTVQLMLALVVLKLLATSFTLGSGGSGGIFAPSLFLGAMLGGVFGTFVHGIWPATTAASGAYALVGMGAVFAGAAHAPMTAVIILFEMTGDYRIIGPLMVASVVSTLLSEIMSRESVYTLKLTRRGVDVLGAEPDLLDTIPVAEAMTREFEAVSPELQVAELMDRFTRGDASSLPVLDREHELVGIVSRSDAEDALLSGRGAVDVGAIMTPLAVTCSADENLTLALQRLTAGDFAALPVLDPNEDNRLVGMLRRRDIITAYQRARRERPEFAARVDRLRQSVAGARIFEAVLGPDSPLANKEVQSVSWPPDILLVAIRRGNRTLIPRGDTILKSGDTVAALAEREQMDALRDLFRDRQRR